MVANRWIPIVLFVVVGGLVVSDASAVAFDLSPDSTLRPASPVSSDSVAWVVSPNATAIAPPGDAVRVVQLASWGGDRANALAFSPDGQLLAVGTSLGIYLYDARTLTEVRFIQTETWVRSVAFSPAGDLLATGSYDKVVRVWRVSDGMILRTLEGHTGWVRSVAFSLDGETLASASDDNTVRLWRVSDGALLGRLTEGTDGARAVAFSPDGELLATGGYENTVRLWRVSDGTLLRTLLGHTGWVRCIVFSPDGKTLASGGFDATARLWRVADGVLLHTLEGHTASVLGVAFSPGGETLATGSVDTTVRLWGIPDGALQRILIGHDDFVFSVSFAPDGKTLASGAVDNTVRLWEVQGGEDLTPLAEEAVPAGEAAQSCVACHHPQGNFVHPGGVSQPARVLEVECATCHLGGARVLNWDPTFPRLPGPLSVSVTLPVASAKVGVPRGTRDISVVIATSGNGEHLYSPRIITAMPVGGRVYYAKGRATDIEVRLEIWSGPERVAVLTTRPQPDGYFSFSANLSSENIELEVPAEQRACLACHNANLDVKSSLPPGEIRLLVMALTPDGKQASDERWIVVDRSHSAVAVVQVALENNGQPVSGLPVQASTRLYEWRGRTFTSVTDTGGIANLQVEALSEAPTHYTFQVPPTVVDGVLYESIESVEVTLPPGATSAPPVTLVVWAQRGSISGRLSGVAITALSPMSVRAIHLPDGMSYQTGTSMEGTFGFDEVPIGQYLIVADTEALAARGLSSAAQLLDLAQSPVTEVVLPLTPLEGFAVQGAVRDLEGNPLPFAWITSEQAGLDRAVQVNSGAWSLFGLPDASRSLVVTAPGFYSQALVVSPSDSASPLELGLTRRPETQSIPWGQGELILPPETRATVSPQEITLEAGWLWGSGGEVRPLTINTGEAEITLPNGAFALEHLAGQTAWFYLMDGQATVRARNTTETVTMQAREMLALTADAPLTPVSLDPVVVAALPPASAPPLPPVWEPSVGAQVRDRLARAGIATAQVITFLTYSLALLTLLLAPLSAIVLLRRGGFLDFRRRK